MVRLIHALPVLLACSTASSHEAASAVAARSTGIEKVVTLIEEMKAQVEKEGKEDDEAYETYKCWCDTSKTEKTAAVKNAETRIAELTAFLESAAGLEGQLKTEIAGLEEDIAEDEDALQTATAQREKEAAEFAQEEADSKECLGALSEAVKVLGKVQLLQKKAGNGKLPEEARPLLLQVTNLVEKPSMARFHGVMQKDLFDALNALDEVAGRHGAFLPRRQLSALAQHSRQKPNDLEGAAAGAKSYNSQSGQIFGILSQMQEDFGADLAAAQKEELEAIIAFHRLTAAKLAEIAAATKAKKDKEVQLADLGQKVAQSKEDLEELKKAMAADQEFLIDLEKLCTSAAEEYAARVKVRGEEIVALGEVLKILTSDEARDLFGKTVGFLQVIADHQGEKGSALMQRRAMEKAVRRVLAVARKNKDWVLASLAVRTRLDSFAKVKEMIDKMLEELKAQQKAEYEKKEHCTKEIDQTEDIIKETARAKEKLEDKKLGLQNALETTQAEIESLNSDIAEMQVSLKRAGEDRKAENQLFQTSVADQRATVQILKKALTRLQEFYNKKALLQAHRQEPGAAVAPPPPRPKGYQKSESSGGVMQLISMVIEEAEREEVALIADEQHGQENYATFASDATASIEANRAAVAEKQEALATTEGALSETEAALLANGAELTKREELLSGLHADCDWLLKYFDVRQKGRKEEMDSIEEAKAILSGAGMR